MPQRLLIFQPTVRPELVAHLESESSSLEFPVILAGRYANFDRPVAVYPCRGSCLLSMSLARPGSLDVGRFLEDMAYPILDPRTELLSVEGPT